MTYKNGFGDYVTIKEKDGYFLLAVQHGNSYTGSCYKTEAEALQQLAKLMQWQEVNTITVSVED